MKAAEVLAKRGHEVTLVEKERRLGGLVNLIVLTPGRAQFGVLVEDLENQIRIQGVDVRLHTEGTLELISNLAPDHVIVSSGSIADRSGFSSVVPDVPSLPGVDQNHVLTGFEAILDPELAQDMVVVLDDDGTRQVAGVAEVLLDAGKRVHMVSRWNTLLPFTANTLDQPILYERLLRKGLRYRLNAWAKRIEPGVVVIYDLYTDEEETLGGVGTVVLGTGRRAQDGLYFSVKDVGVDVHRIGDCVAPRSLDHAIYEGYVAGREMWSTESRFIYEGELERWSAATLGA
jgi:pyruvate/2-oxoglutarate dehydrogenase complex dihydrolipoamide dehydrogenase (E3) component